MKDRINKKVFSSLMSKLEIGPAETNKDRFNDWMKNKVKSVFYSDNERMLNAYNRIIEY